MHSNKNDRQNDLRYYRLRFGYSQKRAARILGHKGPQKISNYEQGRHLPNLHTAFKLAALYRVPVDFLYLDFFKSVLSEVRQNEEQLYARMRGNIPKPLQGSLF